MRIGMAADHAGFSLKNDLIRRLRVSDPKLDIVDFGAEVHTPDDDYPDFVVPMAQALARGELERGVAICGSGVGASVAANKVAGVRAGLCHDSWSVRQGVEHDDMNILVLGARVIGHELAYEIVGIFLQSRFTAEERHARRLEKLRFLESQASHLQITGLDSPSAK